MSEGEQAVVEIRQGAWDAARRLSYNVQTLVLRHSRAWFFIGLLMLYLSTATYTATSIDIVAAMEPAWTLARFGTWDLAGVGHTALRWYFPYDGGIYSDRFPGAILYLVPAYWIADRLGFHDFTFIPGSVTAAVVSATTVMVLHAVYGKVLPTARGVWVATTFTALGTGVWSLAAHAPWSHTLNLMLIALASLALSRRSWGVAGVWLGLSVATRPTMAVGALAIGLVLMITHRSVRPGIKVGLGCIPGVAFLFLYNGLMFGRWSPSNGRELRGDIHLQLTELPSSLLQTLISPAWGLLIYYPILILAGLGAFSAWRLAGGWEKAGAVAGLVVLVTQLSLNEPSGGEFFFGPRLVIEPLVLMAPFLARAVWESGQRHGSRVAVWAIAVGIAIHGVGGILVHVRGGY